MRNDTIMKFKDVADFCRGPFGSSVKKSVCVEKGEDTYKLYAQGNVIKNDFNRGTYYLTKEQFKILHRFELATDDILITCAGTLGKIAIVPGNIEKGIINSVLMRIRVNKQIIIPEYFYYYFQSPQIQLLIFGKSEGATIKNLFATSQLKEFEIPVPSIEIQKKIVSKIKKIELLDKELKEYVIDVEKLKKSLMQKAFRGELVI